MSTFTQNFVQQLFIGGTANITAPGAAVTLADANPGEIIIVNGQGIKITAAQAATAADIRVQVKHTDGSVLSSDIIQRGKINHIGVQPFAADAAQVDYIGYNGTAGSIALNSNELYYARLYVYDFLTGSQDDLMKHGVYKAGAGVTQAQVSEGITNSLIKNFSRDAERLIRFEQTNGGARTAVGTASNLTFTYGSRVVAAAAITATGNVVVGDYVTAIAATTNGVYRVTAIDAGGNLTLATPFQGETINVAGTGNFRIAAATAAAANFGIKLTGLPLAYRVGKIRAKVARWSLQLDTVEGFGITPVTNSVAASLGTGTIRRIGDLEWFTQGHEGEFFRVSDEPVLFDPRRHTDLNVAGGGYDLLDIMFVNDEVIGFQPNVSFKHVTLAVPATTPQYADPAQAQGITRILEAFSGVTANDLNL
jgi:hypothetical protein